MRAPFTAAALTASLMAAACGGATSGSVPIGTVPTTTVPPTAPPDTTVAPPTTSPAPSTTSAAPATPRTTVAAADELSGFQTDPFRREHNLVTPPVPQLTGIRTASHPGYDRVVFDFDGPLPGAVSVRYVERVIADGSGNPVSVAGSAYLQVRFEEAQAHTDAGAPTVASRAKPGLPTINEVVLAGDYEGYVTVALGLAARTPFRVLELSNPTRVVVDVATFR